MDKIVEIFDELRHQLQAIIITTGCLSVTFNISETSKDVTSYSHLKAKLGQELYYDDGRW
jgi:hypothetical protein